MTYSTPRHPWEKERIDSEAEIVNKFGLKNKRELWKGMALLTSFRSQARDLQARLRSNDEYASKQFQAFIARLNRYNILGQNATLDDVLSLTIEDILSRRLQTIVYRKNLAKTQKQARQLITHGHIMLDGRRVTVPWLIVEGNQEELISYSDASPLNDELHPLRQIIIHGTQEQPEENVAEQKPEESGKEQENDEDKSDKGDDSN